MPDIFYSNRFEMGIDTNPIIGSNIKAFIVGSPFPDVSLGEIIQPTRYRNVDVAGDTLEYSDLTMNVLADEDFIAWMQFYDWMIAIKNCKAEDLKTHARSCVIVVKNNKMRSVLSLQFTRAFVTNISGLELATNDQSLETLYFQATIKYEDLVITRMN
jgi:hypothetical protein